MFFLEVALGQFMNVGGIGAWMICPLFQGNVRACMCVNVCVQHRMIDNASLLFKMIITVCLHQAKAEAIKRKREKINDKHQRKFSFSLPFSFGVN